MGPSLKSLMILHQAKVDQVGSCLKAEVMLEWSRMVFRILSSLRSSASETQRGGCGTDVGFPYWFWMFHISEDQAVLTRFILGVVYSNVWILDCFQAVKIPLPIQRSTLHIYTALGPLMSLCVSARASFSSLHRVGSHFVSCPLRSFSEQAQQIRPHTPAVHFILGTLESLIFSVLCANTYQAINSISIFFALFLNFSGFSRWFQFQFPSCSLFLDTAIKGLLSLQSNWYWYSSQGKQGTAPHGKATALCDFQAQKWNPTLGAKGNHVRWTLTTKQMLHKWFATRM